MVLENFEKLNETVLNTPVQKMHEWPWTMYELVQVTDIWLPTFIGGSQVVPIGRLTIYNVVFHSTEDVCP